MTGQLMLLLAAALAVTPAPQKDVSWKRRLDGKAKLVADGGSDIVFLGDETVHFLEEGWGGKAFWDRYWAPAPYRALNLGFAGDRTENVLWRITEGRELDGYRAKAVVLSVGIDNFSVRNDPVGDVISGVCRILEVIRDRQPKARTVLCAACPRGGDPEGPWHGQLTALNRELQKFADGRSVIWCDWTDRCRDLTPEESLIAMTSAVMPIVNEILRGDGLPIAPCCPVAPRYGLADRGKPEALRPVSRIREKSWRGENWWGERFARNRDFIAASGGKVDLVIAGDSISHFWESSGGAAYATLTNRLTVLNCGYGGDQTQNVLWRFQNGELAGYRAKTVMLMIGTNNNGINGYRPENTAAGVKACLDLIAAKQPQAKIILCGYLPRAVGTEDGDPAKDGGADGRNRKTTGLIRKFADGKKVVFLDLYDRFLVGGKIPKELMSDYIHPTEKGYRIWLSELEKLLK